ncbi:MAG: DUF6714 family protein [Pseudomonadota bacterium]
MKYPTAADIEDMVARGFDPSVIVEQRVLCERGKKLLAIRAAAVEAFSHVVLGAGVGLLEANGLDDYADEAALAAFREQDEKQDWSAIPCDHLQRYGCSLSYFDAEGMRFHLPAFLIAEIDQAASTGVLYALTRSMQMQAQYVLLNPAQRRVVRDFLAFALEDDSYAWDWDHIRSALENHWS